MVTSFTLQPSQQDSRGRRLSRRQQRKGLSCDWDESLAERAWCLARRLACLLGSSYDVRVFA